MTPSELFVVLLAGLLAVPCLVVVYEEWSRNAGVGANPATTSPDELFKAWCATRGLQPEKLDDANLWIRAAFEAGMVASGVMGTQGDKA